MRAVLTLVIVLWTANVCKAATNAALPFRTNFVHGASLSVTELETVVRLANLCGIRSVTEVSTELHLNGTTIVVAGDEKFEDRSVIFKTLLIYRKESQRPRPVDAPSEGEFWAGSAQPGQEERTIVRIGDRELRVGLLNGVTPVGADKIMGAFAKGEIRVKEETLTDALSEVDVMRPRWIGISGGKLAISFSSRPLNTYIFTLDEDEITLVSRIRKYE